MLRNGINSGPFLDPCQLLVDLRGDNMELPLAVIGHQFNEEEEEEEEEEQAP